jgi:hypothetical protein
VRDKCSTEPEVSRKAPFPRAGSAARSELVQLDAFPRAYLAVSAAIRTPPAARTTVVSLLGEAVICPAARWRGIANSRALAVATSGSITRYSEREVAVSCYLVPTSLKMSKQSTSDSFYVELFITEIDRLSCCQPFGAPDRLLTAINKQKPTLWRHCTRNLLKTLFFKINSRLQQCTLTNFLH